MKIANKLKRFYAATEKRLSDHKSTTNIEKKKKSLLTDFLEPIPSA